MFDYWIRLLHNVDAQFFLLSIFLFSAGYLLAIPVVRNSINFLTAYPHWLWEKLKKFLDQKPSFWQIAIFIFFFNSISLFLIVISGLGIILPYIFIFWLGLNVGVIVVKEDGGCVLAGAIFLSPHAIFELPAAWLSGALGMKLSKSIYWESQSPKEMLVISIEIYWKVVLLLLLIAAVIESFLIYLLLKKSKHAELFPQKPFDTEQGNCNDKKDKLMP